jgi:hypothetical protein
MDRETREAYASLKPCLKCKGFPSIRYDPGVTYSYCVTNTLDCPCLAAAPDYDPAELARRINNKNKK